MTPSIEEEKQRMEEIYKLTSILLENKENSLEELLKASCKLLGAEIGVICLIKEGQYFVKNVYCELDLEIDSTTVYKLENTFCSETLKENRLLAIADVAHSKYNTFPSHTELGINSYIGIPIKFDNSEVGTINFSSTKPKSEDFSNSDIDLMMHLNQWISHHLNRQYYKESLDKKNTELENKNRKLELIMEENNQLMQILVHDLKSPLSNIKMLSYLFQDFVRDAESEELLTIFNKSLDFVFHLIEQMETLNSVENFPLNNYIEEFDLNNFIKENLKDFNKISDAKSIKINYDFSDQQAIIKTDINFLKRIFHNLLTNALKFSPFNKQIFVSLLNFPTYYELRIKDEGPGIAKEEQNKLFKKFTKLDNRPTNSESSSGLGLFIVKELLKSLKGEISVESEVGKGSTFIIKLPCEL